jgi:SnoaL-like domain
VPSRDRVSGLIALVERSEFVEAIEQFYAEDATMQENGQPPRGGRAVLIEGERKMMAGFAEMHARRVGPVFIDGDDVVIRWQFDFTVPGGRTLHLDELAYQRWQGDRVITERFYYDPAWIRG